MRLNRYQKSDSQNLAKNICMQNFFKIQYPLKRLLITEELVSPEACWLGSTHFFIHTKNPLTEMNHNLGISTYDPLKYKMLNSILILSTGLLRVCTKTLIFLFLNQNVCCGYSKEHPKHMLKLMGKKIFTI